MIYNLEEFTKIIQTIKDACDDADAINQFSKTRPTPRKNSRRNIFRFDD